jgi:hypothetical protein
MSIGVIECLDEKMRRERNTKRLQELHQQIIWPTVTDLDPRTYIPEAGLYHIVHVPSQTCSNDNKLTLCLY